MPGRPTNGDDSSDSGHDDYTTAPLKARQGQGPLDGEKTRRLASIMIADLCKDRSVKYRLDSGDKAKADVIDQKQLEASRRSNIPGTAEWRNAATATAALGGWSSFASTEDLEKELDPQGYKFNEGQSHRAKIQSNLRPGNASGLRGRSDAQRAGNVNIGLPRTTRVMVGPPPTGAVSYPPHLHQPATASPGPSRVAPLGSYKNPIRVEVSRERVWETALNHSRPPPTSRKGPSGNIGESFSETGKPRSPTRKETIRPVLSGWSNVNITDSRSYMQQVGSTFGRTATTSPQLAITPATTQASAGRVHGRPPPQTDGPSHVPLADQNPANQRAPHAAEEGTSQIDQTSQVRQTPTQVSTTARASQERSSKGFSSSLYGGYCAPGLSLASTLEADPLVRELRKQLAVMEEPDKTQTKLFANLVQKANTALQNRIDVIKEEHDTGVSVKTPTGASVQCSQDRSRPDSVKPEARSDAQSSGRLPAAPSTVLKPPFTSPITYKYDMLISLQQAARVPADFTGFSPPQETLHKAQSAGSAQQAKKQAVQTVTASGSPCAAASDQTDYQATSDIHNASQAPVKVAAFDGFQSLFDVNDNRVILAQGHTTWDRLWPVFNFAAARIQEIRQHLVRGVCFWLVIFKTAADARAALEHLRSKNSDGNAKKCRAKPFDGRLLGATLYKANSPDDQPEVGHRQRQLIVSGVTCEDVWYEYFADQDHENIESVHPAINTAESERCTVVTFSTHEAAYAALQRFVHIREALYPGTQLEWYCAHEVFWKLSDEALMHAVQDDRGVPEESFEHFREPLIALTPFAAAAALASSSAKLVEVSGEDDPSAALASLSPSAFDMTDLHEAIVSSTAASTADQTHFESATSVAPIPDQVHSETESSDAPTVAFQTPQPEILAPVQVHYDDTPMTDTHVIKEITSTAVPAKPRRAIDPFFPVSHPKARILSTAPANDSSALSDISMQPMQQFSSQPFTLPAASVATSAAESCSNMSAVSTQTMQQLAQPAAPAATVGRSARTIRSRHDIPRDVQLHEFFELVHGDLKLLRLKAALMGINILAKLKEIDATIDYFVVYVMWQEKLTPESNVDTIIAAVKKTFERIQGEAAAGAQNRSSNDQAPTSSGPPATPQGLTSRAGNAGSRPGLGASQYRTDEKDTSA